MKIKTKFKTKIAGLAQTQNKNTSVDSKNGKRKIEKESEKKSENKGTQLINLPDHNLEKFQDLFTSM